MNTQEINRHGIPKNEEYLIRECILSLTGQDVTARIVWEKLGKTPILVRGKRPKRQFSNICVTLFKELGWNKVKVQGNEVWRAPSNQIHRCKADSPSRARPSCSTILAEGQTSSEQKLLSSIQALSKKDGSCFASDQYLSNHLGISKHEFTSLLTRMTSEGKIRIDTENEKRRIYPLSQAGFHPPYTHIYGDRDDNLSLSFNNTLSNKIDITDMREGDSEPESGYHSHIPSKFHSNFSETPPGNTYSPEAILITDCKNSGLNLQIPEKLSLTEGELDIAREDLLKMSRGWPSGTVL